MSETHGEMNHRPGATLSAGSQTVLPTVRFSSATTVVFTTAANSVDLSLQAISNGGKGSRVWIVFSSAAADGSRVVSGERVALARIEHGGATRLDTFETREASVYLYQLTN